MCAARSGLLCFLLTLVTLSNAQAQPNDSEVRRRLERIERILKTDEPAARAWRTVWLFAYSGLVVGQAAVVVVVDDPGLRADATVGGVKSALGFGAVLLTPFRPASAASELAKLPARTPEQRRAKLAAAERWLGDAADDEALVTGWTARVAASVVNLAGSYYLWLAEERFGSGWLALGTGMAVSEVQIRTAPTGL